MIQKIGPETILVTEVLDPTDIMGISLDAVYPHIIYAGKAKRQLGQLLRAMRLQSGGTEEDGERVYRFVVKYSVVEATHNIGFEEGSPLLIGMMAGRVWIGRYL